jgi:glycosyltransferase involved in cell wall biosynthesis
MTANEGATSRIQQIWRQLPQPVRSVANHAFNSMAQQVGQFRGSLERKGARATPVCVMGLHRAVLGIGRGARLFVAALDDMGVETSSWDVSELFGTDLTLPAPHDDFSHAKTVVSHLNPIEHLHALAFKKGPRPSSGFRVGYWAWETSRVPDEWIRGISAVDEIWCPSNFTAESILKLVGNARPIRVVPHPIPNSLAGISDKARFGISAEKTTFFAACDLRSSLDRKNPLGAIEAFRLSNCGANGAAELLIKVHGDFVGSGLSSLREAAAKVPGVRIMDKKLTADEMKALRSSIDVVLSPHRSEGFGLVLAEAMRAGKPVIATGWSGNMDFMDNRSAALIAFKEVPVVDSSGVYKTGTWAEPDLEHAATLISNLANSEDEQAKVGQAGLERIGIFADTKKWQSNVRHLLQLP